MSRLLNDNDSVVSIYNAPRSQCRNKSL